MFVGVVLTRSPMFLPVGLVSAARGLEFLPSFLSLVVLDGRFLAGGCGGLCSYIQASDITTDTLLVVQMHFSYGSKVLNDATFTKLGSWSSISVQGGLLQGLCSCTPIGIIVA